MILLGAIAALAILALLYEKRSNGVREKEWALERGALLQRIQAPEIAVREFSERPERKKVRPVPIDDDKAYAEAQERRMSGDAD